VPLRVRLVALLGALVLVLTGAGVVLGTALARVEANRLRVAEVLQPASVRSRALLVALVDQETGQRGYVLTGDDAFLEPYRNGNRTLPVRLAELREDFADDPSMLAKVAEVEEAAREWREVGAVPEIEARRRGDVARALELVRGGEGKAAFDVVRERVDDLQAGIDGKVAAGQEADVDEFNLFRSITVVGAVLTALLLAGGAVLVRRWTLLPVLELRNRMRAVAAGNIWDEVLVEGPPEIAAIGRDAEGMRRRIVAELEAARDANEALVQHSPVVASLRRELLAENNEAHDAASVAGSVLSAEGVLAGDTWEALVRPDGSLAIVVTDVSGHGAEAGLLAFGFRQRLNALLRTRLALDEVVANAARWIGTDEERFLSCLVLAIEAGGSALQWVNAGHPAALVMGSDRRLRSRLGPTGPLLSSVTGGWSVARQDLRPGDLLVLCTDGVTEARSEAGDEFGDDGLLEVVAGLTSWSPAAAVSEVLAAVRRFAADHRRDDVTCVAALLR
jgi:sigma-B regulation protein RsbU (phosphoserine phosphatase)